MIPKNNFDDVTKKNVLEYNPNLPQIPDYLCKKLKI